MFRYDTSHKISYRHVNISQDSRYSRSNGDEAGPQSHHTSSTRYYLHKVQHGTQGVLKTEEHWHTLRQKFHQLCYMAGLNIVLSCSLFPIHKQTKTIAILRIFIKTLLYMLHFTSFPFFHLLSNRIKVGFYR